MNQTFEKAQSATVTLQLNFTKKSLEGLEPGTQRRYYRDTNPKSPKGFGLYVTPSGAKTYFLTRTIDGVTKRVPIGRFPDLPLAMARREAEKCAALIASGKDPTKSKRASRARSITLSQVFEDYLNVRGSNLKASTIANYRRALDIHLKDWKPKKIGTITRDMVETRHRRLAATSKSSADNTMRVLRVLFNFAMGKYEDESGRPLFHDNPTRRLSDVRVWQKPVRRQRVITPAELPAWRSAVDQSSMLSRHKSTLSDYLLFVLYSGLRRREASTLRWNQIDFGNRTVRIVNTKNRNALLLPLSPWMYEILARRQLGGLDQWVFPGARKGKPIVEPKSHIRLIGEMSGVQFTVHDLRRTFITVAESLDISPYAIKALVNHSIGGDVTEGYVVMDVDRLRDPIEKIGKKLTDYMER